ncbi:MAG TPA: hypothetical protein VKA32_06260 [Gammaproteobacteria bacterium]|nr:hypothetical protein [Gammaproteobacteria bacterium]
MLTRKLYRHIRRQVLRLGSNGSCRLDRVNVIVDGRLEGGHGARCRIEMQSGRRPAVFAEAVAGDVSSALARCLGQLSPWLPAP